ncbi:MAG: 3-deoxy-manno-octulosonate cytidylyltransferase [Pyrinomonadaceae bacterium]|nr:3-deoxy-manno-octulosonate cytidylyltransferase [Pyrinomonadaceae bacterium]
MIAIIPARYESVRLEGKLLLPLAGKALILHTLEQASRSTHVGRILVATDDKRIAEVVEGAGYEAIMTASDHESGTDRIAEAASTFDDDSIIVNVQADEPLIDPVAIDLVVEAMLSDPEILMSTCCEVITDPSDVTDPNVVKVVIDKQGFARYFSRSPIPFPRDAVAKHGSLEAALNNEDKLVLGFRKHLGLYVYRKGFLMRFAGTARSELERTEMLEQLRALDMGAGIKIVETKPGSMGVDTRADYDAVKAIMEAAV